MRRFLVVCAFLIALNSNTIAQVVPQVAFPGLPFWNRPVALVDPLDGTDRLFLVEHRGIIYSFENDPSVVSAPVFLDIESKVYRVGESGLVGLAFHPDYENNGYFYTYYIADNPLRAVLSRWSVDAFDSTVADTLSEVVLFEDPKTLWYHNGGRLVFGPDGYLYCSVGDDGVPANGQDLTTLRGSLLRIDVDNTDPGLNYAIPPDNPLAGNTDGYREEIYAWGLRNLWGYNFDFDTGILWGADVGLDTYEEVNHVISGENYGWPILEGPACYIPTPCDTDTVGLDLVPPLYYYAHDPAEGFAITGGYVYKGTNLSGLQGKYIFSDYVTGRIWAMDWDDIGGAYVHELYSDPGFVQVSSFCEDKDHELFITNMNGRIYTLTGTATDAGDTPGRLEGLSQNYPNPFNPQTTIRYTLDTRGDVRIDIFDVRGALVRTLVNESVETGTHVAEWDGTDQVGQLQPSGVYFYRLSIDGIPAESRRMVLLK